MNTKNIIDVPSYIKSLEGQGIQIGRFYTDFDKVLTIEALIFLKKLVEKFGESIEELLISRSKKQFEIDGGKDPDFLDSTKHIRDSKWTICDQPDDLKDRSIEITVPVDPKMLINGYNSYNEGVRIMMADFEDATSPTWKNIIYGQLYLIQLVEHSLSYTNQEGKHYVMNDRGCVLEVRPRGFHLKDDNLLINGKPIPASLMDFGLFFFHNSKKLIEKGSGPYFYLPKLQSHLEARLWNKIFVFSQDYLKIPQGTIRATVLIEHVLATFEMDEILYELRDHSAGLNCGRWDYIFSYIKIFNKRKDKILPERSQVSMLKHFMHSYVKLEIETCHKRNAPAIGGMSAKVPVGDNETIGAEAVTAVIVDKLLEFYFGNDGTWIAHPKLGKPVRQVYDRVVGQQNQINVRIKDLNITAEDLLKQPSGTITENGAYINIKVAILYIENWFKGQGAVAINGNMEDMATFEISRSQLWQWLNHGINFDDTGRLFSKDVYLEILNIVINELGEPDQGYLDEAVNLLTKLVTSPKFIEFATFEAYPILINKYNDLET
jgi:malate synthase